MATSISRRGCGARLHLSAGTSGGREGAMEDVGEQSCYGCDGEADGEVDVPVGGVLFAVLY